MFDVDHLKVINNNFGDAVSGDYWCLEVAFDGNSTEKDDVTQRKLSEEAAEGPESGSHKPSRREEVSLV